MHCLGPPLASPKYFMSLRQHCSAAVAYVNKLYTKDPLPTHLIQCLAYFQALFDFRIRAVHISGHLNVGANDLSRGQQPSFELTHPRLLSPHRSVRTPQSPPQSSPTEGARLDLSGVEAAMQQFWKQV